MSSESSQLKAYLLKGPKIGVNDILSISHEYNLHLNHVYPHYSVTTGEVRSGPNKGKKFRKLNNHKNFTLIVCSPSVIARFGEISTFTNSIEEFIFNDESKPTESDNTDLHITSLPNFWNLSYGYNFIDKILKKKKE